MTIPESGPDTAAAAGGFATATPLPHDVADTMAGEYVLGTLSAAGRAEVEARRVREAVLDAAVARWEERLLPLATLAAPVAPPDALWTRIAGTVDSIEAAPTPHPPHIAMPQCARSSWWSSLPLWRGLSGAGFAAAAVLASLLVLRVGQAPSAPQYLVVLVAPQSQAPGWVVQASSAGPLSLTPLAPVSVPAQKSLQFWTKADGWAVPVSLGLVVPGQTVRVPLDKLPPLQPNQLFELTLEPAAGSPTGRPTGPIQFIGRAVEVRT